MADRATGGWSPANLPDLHGRYALVTGAASGLGLATATELALHGAQVLLADVNLAGGEAAARLINQRAGAERARFRALDLGKLEAIRAFAGRMLDEGARLDILVNNAGILPPFARRETAGGFELGLGISCLGHYALTGLLLPALRRSAAPRVVSVSSIVHRRARLDFDDLQAKRSYQPQRAYSQAKLAALLYAQELQRRAARAGSGILSLAAHPGIARTAIGADRDRQQRTRLSDSMEQFAMHFVMRWFGQDAERGAWPLLYAAAAPQVHAGGFYGPDGFAELRGLPVEVRPAARATDEVAGQRLWAACEQLTGITYDWSAA